jgi:hypothetical protein
MMLTTMLLLTSHVLLAGPGGNTADDPPLRVWLSQNGNYAYPERAKVYVKSADAGYLVVLRADADGRVRVLFPLDPADNQRIDGGKKLELKGRGGREAFVADDTAGHGTVLAALSDTPFLVDRVARDGHWDLGALSAMEGTADDAEAVLRRLVERMKPTGDKVAYAVATYLVSQRYARAQYISPFDVRWGYDLFGGGPAGLGYEVGPGADPGAGWGYEISPGYGYWGLAWYGPWYR